MPIYKRLLALVKPHIRRLVLAGIFMAFTAACIAAVAYLIEPLLNDVFFKQDVQKLKYIPALVLAVYLFKGFCFFCQAYLMNYVGLAIVNDLRVKMYAHVQTLSLRFFDKHPSGTMISRLVSDVSMIQGAVTTAMTGLVLQVFTAIGLICVLFYRDPKLAFIGIFVLPVAFYPIVYFGRRLRRLGTSGQIIMGSLVNLLSETLRGVKVIKAYNTSEYEVGRFTKECRRSVDNLMRSVTIRSLSSPLLEGLGGICLAAIIWYGGYAVIRGESTPGAFISFMAALLLLYEPIKKIAQINSEVQGGLSAATRIFEILDTKPDIVDKEGALSLEKASGALELNDVWFSYKENRPVLKGVNLKIKPGEMIALVGPSGGGKTTIANLVPRFYDVEKGEILIDGLNIKDVKIADLREQIAVVSQEVFLFNDTVRSNISYGRFDASDAEIEKAAKMAYAHEFIDCLPSKYEDVIGESGGRLSGGQRQRLAIARALLKNAPILILDEATSALDTESEKYVQKALDNLMIGRTTLVIAHRLSTVRHADKIVVVDDGLLVEAGSHDELLAKGGLYNKLYQMQFADQENEDKILELENERVCPTL